MKLRKAQLAATVGAALLVAGTAVQAQNLQVQLYGQVNRALMWADNETQSKVFHVDGNASSTRFGIRGTSDIAPGLRAGAMIETEMQSNPSDEVSFDDPSRGSGGGAVRFAERWLDAFFEGAWGRINLGQGRGAADNATTIDLSGTALANDGSCMCNWGGGIPFTDTTGAATGLTPNDVIDNLDFESRYDRAQYTTPTFAGFRVQASLGQKSDDGEAREIALWYRGQLAGRLEAAIGWSIVNTGAGPLTQDRDTKGGSISWLHTSGFNVTAIYSTRELEGDGVEPLRDADYKFLKVGYKLGQHAVSAGYGIGEDQAAAGVGATGMSVGYTWSPVRWAEIYAAYTMFELDAPGVSANDITTGAIGTRIRF